MSSLSDLLPAGSSGKTFSATASGPVTGKKPVVLNSAGTVTQVGESNLASSLGSAVTFNGSNATSMMGGCYDAVTNTQVLIYRNDAVSNYWHIAIGVISGETTVWGTPVQVASDSNYNSPASVCAIGGGKVIATYLKSNGYQYARCGQITAATKTIVFGTEITLYSTATNMTAQALAYSSVRDATVVIVNRYNYSNVYRLVVSGTTITADLLDNTGNYALNGGSQIVNDPTTDEFMVATKYTSGSNKFGVGRTFTLSASAWSFATVSLSFDSQVESNLTLAYDSSIDRYVVTWQGDNNGYVWYCVGIPGANLSSNIMTWGTATAFHSYSSYVYADYLATSYNAQMDRVVTIYEDRDPNTLYYSVGKVAASSVTWETGTEFSTSNNDYPVIYYDSTAKRNIVAYYENDPQQGQVHVMKVEGVYPNMTTTNFLGFADASIANAASGDVVLRGGTVTDAGGPNHITSATGGTITTDGDYKVHTFTSSGNFVVSTVTNYPSVDILQIAGGGGGGRRRGGGGGAGGYLYETGVGITAGTYAVTVGAGGAAAAGSGSPTNSSNGGNSSIGSLITASVGGGGGGGNAHGANGGSGGGGQGLSAAGNGGLKTYGQGYNGVTGVNLSYGGGGGGSSAMGGVIGGETNSGGAGTSNSITGTAVVRAGGGGAWNAGSAGTGGASAGGSGSSNASNATANTGSGGGGGGDDASGGAGGSGIVIVRYRFQNDSSSLTTGSKYYVQDDGSITSPTVPHAYTIDGATYDSVSFSLSSQENTPTGMTFNNDGTKMYVTGENGNQIYQYSLSTGYDLSTASYDSVSINVNSQQEAVRSVVFNNDGTSLFITGTSPARAHRYALSTAYNLSTASYANERSSVFGQEAYPCGLIFNPEGTKMYIVGSQNDTVYQYTLSTAFDVSTTSYASKSMSASDGQTSPTGLAFNSDGTKLFVSGETTPKINQYTLSTAYDVSTGSFDSISYTYTQGTGVLRNIDFNNDATKFYLVDSGPDAVYQYSTGGGPTSSTVAGLAISTTSLLLTGES